MTTIHQSQLSSRDEDDAWLAASGNADGSNLPQYVPDAAPSVSEALGPVSEALISVAFQQSNSKTGRPTLIGNFGDWAESEQIAKFDQIARGLGFDAVHENEVGDLLAIYTDAEDIALPNVLSRTQEELIRTWEDYP